MRFDGHDIDGVLFDMDGTLVSSIPVVERVWSGWARAHGLDVDAVLASIHGKPADASIRAWLPDASPEEVQREFDALLDAECADTTGVLALPGSHAIVAFLDAHAVPWVVVTSAMPVLARARMEAAGIHAPLLVTPADVERGKPDPEGFLKGASLIDADPTRCVAFEDSPAGLQAAHDAGCIVVDVTKTGLDAAVALFEFEAADAASR